MKARSRHRGFGPALLAALVGLVASGCADERGAGPGAYGASVEMPGGAPGAALLYVSGVGVRDVIGEGGTRGWAHPISGEGPASVRALLIDADPSGALTFRIEVDDVSAPTPTVTVLEIADRANELRAVTADVRVHLTLR